MSETPYWIEKPESGSLTNTPPSKTIVGQVIGEANEDNANLLAIGATPAYVYVGTSKLYRQDVKLDSTAYKIYTATVPYAERKKEDGSYSFTFDTTGGTALVKCAKDHIQSYPAAGETAGTHNGAIGVADGKVEGVQAVIPALKLSVTFNHPDGEVTIGFVKTLASYTGYTNDDTFLEFEAGELLFIGASGSDGSEAAASVTYNFIASGNATGLTFGSIASVAKKGHEYAWVEFMENATGGVAGKEPRCVYVERIYDAANFPSIFGWGP